MTNEIKGLAVSVFRDADGSDCTNHGLSSYHEEFILTGVNPLNGRMAEGPFSPRPDCPELVLVSGPLNTVRAVPRLLLDSKKWVMFGGNFVYSSDSRFPSDQPIKIFDRVE